jgi:hypothetical protein
VERDSRLHSSIMGNLSMGFGVLVLLVFIGGVAGLGMLPNADTAAPGTPFYLMGETYAYLMCAAFPFAVVGMIAGIIGLFNQTFSRVLAGIGVLINVGYLAGFFLVIGGSVIIGLLTGKF